MLMLLDLPGSSVYLQGRTHAVGAPEGGRIHAAAAAAVATIRDWHNSRLAQKVRSFHDVSARTRTLHVAVVVAALAALVALAGCHRKTDDITRNQQRYDVVTESAGGTVSSTVGAPGEAAAAGVTATSLDTTTNFTVGGVSSTSTTAATANDGSLAGTLPPIADASSASHTPPAPPSRASAPVRRPSDRPLDERVDSAATTTMNPGQAPATPPAAPPEQTTHPPEPPEPPARPAPEPDTSKPPPTDTTSTSPPQG